MNRILLALAGLCLVLAILTVGLWRVARVRGQQVDVERRLTVQAMEMYDQASKRPRPVLIVQKSCQLPHTSTAPTMGGWDTAPWSASPTANADPDLVEALGYRIAALEAERDDLYRQMRQDAAKPEKAPEIAWNRTSRAIWAGWSLTNGWPALGGQMRLIGPVWAGGWVRPGPAWDIGPTLGLVW